MILTMGYLFVFKHIQSKYSQRVDEGQRIRISFDLYCDRFHVLIGSEGSRQLKYAVARDAMSGRIAVNGDIYAKKTRLSLSSDNKGVLRVGLDLHFI